MFKRPFFLFIAFLFTSPIIAQIKWPAITQTCKPWTRWWWEGSAVNKKDLAWNMEQYAKAGLGGMEITPIYGVRGYESQFIKFLSPQWMEMFDYTLAEAKRLSLGVDLANATGWPFGGSWVSDEDASKTVYYKIYTLNAGEQLKENIFYDQPALVRTANNKQASIDTLLKPATANKDLQSLALDQIIYPGKLPLQLLMAYSDNGGTIDLTNKVDANGKLNWTASNDKWTLYALFAGLHGKMVERAAPGGEGYAIDHFSSIAVKNYFKKFDEAFKGHDISYLRAFFNDSYEVDDARGQANWTPDFFSEFKKRRGYDLKNYLPALFQKDSADINSRVIYDYRSTIDELLLEHFTEAWKKWGVSKGALVRNQSHGSPANTLDLYAAVDIPETEGNDILRFKFAASAANVSGKKLVSSESATWLNEHFLSSWGDVKKAIDLYFLGGVNHIFYHGTAYSPKEAPWPGWLFYAAVHFQPTDPQWKDFHTLNEYIARVQSFLQSSKPDNDVLLYYPIADRYSQPGTELLQHFDGMERNFEKTDFEYLSKWMLENNIGFDFFSDRQLKNFTVSNKKIVTGGNEYRLILLPGNKFIPIESWQKLFELANKGATILVYGDYPRDVPGLANIDKNRIIFHKYEEQLKFFRSDIVMTARIGKGSFISGKDNLSLLIVGSGAIPASLQQISIIRKKTNDGKIYFINNRRDLLNDWITLPGDDVKSVALFDPMTGKSGLIDWRKDHVNGIDIKLRLNPFESVIVQTFNIKKTGSRFHYTETTSPPQEIKGKWTIEFLNGGPTIPAKVNTDKLASWTDLNGDDLKNFSGTAKYSIFFLKPAGNARAYLLDLGQVHETAEVFLNGKRVATLIGPSFQVEISSTDLKQTNHLEIVVANLAANRIAYMDRNNIPWKIFYNTNMPARKRENSKNGLFDALSWKPLPSGLLGPVTITPELY